MSHTECMYLCSPDIRVISDCTKYIVRIDFSTVEGDVVRAGTPISRDGKIANNADAFGILLRDTWRVSPFAKICIDGFIDFPLAQEHSGVVLTPEAKAAMKNVVFVGDPESGAGGGVSPEEVITIVKENSPGGKVTKEDEYKMLQVVNGVWAVVDIRAEEGEF